MLKIKLTMAVKNKRNIKVFTRDAGERVLSNKFTSLKKACEFVKKEMGGKEK